MQNRLPFQPGKDRAPPQPAGRFLAGYEAKTRATAATASVAAARAAKHHRSLVLTVGPWWLRVPAGIYTPHATSTSPPGVTYVGDGQGRAAPGAEGRCF